MLSTGCICISTKILNMLSLYREALEMKVSAKAVSKQVNLQAPSVD